MLTSPTGLAKTYIPGSDIVSSYGGKSRFKITFFDEGKWLDFSTLTLQEK